MSITVYRVEHAENGFGPYDAARFHPIATILCNAHNGCARHPALTKWSKGTKWRGDEDFIGNYRTGMLTLKGIFEWFREFWTDLEDHNFILVQYQVERLFDEDDFGQVLFDVNGAVKIRTVNIRMLVNREQQDWWRDQD